MGGGGGESLQVSVSFGKYENDAALSWEKWSTFSPNKYLEEVGKCSTPGSVAQKKAFFEAHYKKIAAMKAEAELLETTQMIDGSPRFEEAVNESSPLQVLESLNSSASASASAGEKLEEDESSSSLGLQVLESQPSESLNSSASAAEKLEEAAFVNAESMKLVQQHFQVELDPPQIKINPKKEVKNSIGMKKKPASNKQTNKIPLIPKTPETPATRLSKPKPKPKPKEASTSSLKKAGAPSPSKNKNQSLSETRLVPLHLSMSMNSDTASSSSRRRSLFMEQMGDKDIVKRAFKTFQNRVNQLPSSPKQLPTKQKTSTSTAYQKENERSRKAAAAEKVNPATWKSRDRSVGVDERALKSQETSERRKEFFKKLSEKSNARMASSKSKEVKDTEMKTMPKAQGLLKKTTGSSSSSCIL